VSAFAGALASLLTGFTSAFFSTLAGAEAGVAGALGASAANADSANTDTIVAISAFILISF
jgi:hypothetical protein